MVVGLPGYNWFLWVHLVLLESIARMRIGRLMKWPISGVRRRGRRHGKRIPLRIRETPKTQGNSGNFCRFSNWDPKIVLKKYWKWFMSSLWLTSQHPERASQGIHEMMAFSKSRRHFCRCFFGNYFVIDDFTGSKLTEIATSFYRKTRLFQFR